MRPVAIGAHVLPVRTWNPAKDGVNATFSYIDIASVSQDRKVIDAGEPRPCAEAPSRARQLIAQDDVLVSTVRPNLNAVAKVGIENHGATASTGFCVLRANARTLNAGYLFHWVRSKEFISNMVGLASGQSYPAVSDRIIKASEIPLPALNEQKRIAAILDQADALRRLRTHALDRLNALGQAIFHEMFGDLVANTRQFPMVSVGDAIEGFDTGKNLAEDPDGGQPGAARVLKISAVTSGTFKPDESKALPTTYTPPSHHYVRNGDILFSRANTAELIGATAMVLNCPGNLVLPDKLWRFVWKQRSQVEPRFMLALFSSRVFRAEISKRATGTSGSMKNIGQSKVLGIRFGCPPLAAQRTFALRVEGVAESLLAANAANVRCESLFTSLQRRAFRGEL